MTDTASPTGRHEDRDGTPYLVFERTFRAPIADVWAAVTEPERLVRWIGTWAGDPAAGRVAFRMTAESPDAPEEDIVIDECVEPTRLVLRSDAYGSPGRQWTWRLDLSEADGLTTLVFAQEILDPTVAVSLGAGWDYYLDRLVAAEGDGDVAAVDFATYSPAYDDHYRAQVALALPPGGEDR